MYFPHPFVSRKRIKGKKMKENVKDVMKKEKKNRQLKKGYIRNIRKNECE